MKRILIFSLAYYPHVGGAEVAIKEITDRVTDIEWHMLTLRFNDEPREEKIGNVYVHRVGGGSSYLSKIFFIPSAARAAVSLNKKYHFDAAWAMMLYMLFPLTLARVVGLRLPYALTVQEGDPFEHVFERWRIKIFAPLLKFGLVHASVVQTISTYLAGWVKRNKYKGPIEIIPNGVDTKLFAGAPVPHQNVVLITTSRLVRKNAVDDILRALALLPEARLRVLGVGPEEGMLRALASKLRVAGRVEFVGYVDYKKLPEALHAADIFIRPSRSEGMGNSFIEAMAAGLPVIATQEGGIADFLFDAKRNPDKPTTGWAVDKDSPEQIAAAVKDLLGNPTKAEKVIENAKKLAFEKYDWDLLARDMRERVFAPVRALPSL